MPDDKRISELTTAEQTSASDLFETAIPNALSSTGFVSKKNSLATLATFMANTLAFTNLLDTQAKTLIGAINECFASSGGASVAMGTTDPSSASGSDGDLYIKYDGTSYAVLGFWVKINGGWRTISTGGGMAFVEITQADYNQLSYADKHSNIPYLITDGTLPAIEAGDVTYDNTGSTLSAGDVNEAIDELDNEKLVKDFSTLGTLTIDAANDLLPIYDADAGAVKQATVGEVGDAYNKQETITLTPQTGITITGSVSCIKVGKLVSINISNVNFANTGLNQLLIKGAPKAVATTYSSKPAGSNLTNTNNIASNVAFIEPNGNIYFNIHSNSTTPHWLSLVYVTSE